MINEHSSKLLLKQRIFLFELVKRLIDIFGSIILLIIFSPVLMVVGFLVYRTNHNKITAKYPRIGHKNNIWNNIIFKQKRVGPKGEFFMYKFHSMYIVDNDRYLEKEFPELWKKYKENDWKLPMNEDPRITPIGRFIRSTSIDEMPQFLNVLRGEMSLVGPRAYREAELKEYENKYPNAQRNIKIIRTAKPGITGLWQTSGRNELSFEKRAELDSNYIKNRSFRQELFILLKTPFAMLSRW